MTNMIRWLEEKPWVLYGIAAVLIFPALFINLGIMPLRFDGAFRGLIAYEMLLSGDYLTPTINGEMYFNKPPLYNWILLLLFKYTGNYSEFMIRLPAVGSYIIFGISIFLVLRKDIGTEKALVNALIFMTGGCMFFGLSSVGLIDFTLGFVVFLAIMNIYYQHRRANYFLLFSVSYFLTALGFLIKGLPAIAFLAISILVFFIYKREWKKLFCWQHFTGILTFFIVVGTYYALYFSYNPGYYDMVITTLFRESLIKSSFADSMLRIIQHVSLFPFKVTYNLLPWTLLLIFVFRKGFLKIIHSDPFLKFSAYMLFFNAIIYWLSSGTQMKYLIPIFPFYYFVLVEFYYRYRNENIRTRIAYILFLMIPVIILGGSILTPFLELTKDIPGIAWISIITSLCLALLIYLFIRSRKLMVPLLILTLLVARIAFNLVLQPIYVSGLDEVWYKADAIEVGRMTKGVPLQLCTTINEDVSYYISRERQEILPRNDCEDHSTGMYYIFDAAQIEELKQQERPFKVHYNFATETRDKKLFLTSFME